MISKQNQPLTEDELDVTRKSRLAAEESLQHVRTKMEALELELSVLESQEHDLMDKIEHYSARLSSHNKLPYEILRHIFKCCIHEKTPTYRGSAYTLSHVCSAWRYIVLDTPELWTGISLQLTEENEKRIRVARQWLSRAGTLPRSISIKQNYLECDGWGNNITLNLVAHYPLRSLELKLHHKQLKQLEGLLDRSLSTLEVLRLKPFPGTGDTEMLPFLFRPADILPKLNTLVLEGDWDLQNLTAFGSWSRIVHLDIKSEISALQCFFILQQCCLVEYCRLYVQSTGIVPPVPDIILPQIHGLYVYTGGVTLKLLVDAVTAPKLKSLHFLRPAQSQEFSDVDTAAFYQMIERCQGLKHLTIFRVGPTSEPLNPLALLERLPHLETMQIANGMFDEDAMKRISLGEVGPTLKQMIFRSRHDANGILRMVEVRQQNASLNSYGPLAKVSPFTEITFNCVSVSSSLKEGLISRKNALENSYGKITINLTFNH